MPVSIPPPASEATSLEKTYNLSNSSSLDVFYGQIKLLQLVLSKILPERKPFLTFYSTQPVPELIIQKLNSILEQIPKWKKMNGDFLTQPINEFLPGDITEFFLIIEALEYEIKSVQHLKTMPPNQWSQIQSKSEKIKEKMEHYTKLNIELGELKRRSAMLDPGKELIVIYKRLTGELSSYVKPTITSIVQPNSRLAL